MKRGVLYPIIETFRQALSGLGGGPHERQVPSMRSHTALG